MLDNKFFHLFIVIVWMSGLLGILLTVTYALQERNRHRRSGASPWVQPRILAPLYASIAIFCVGLALHAYASQQSISLWITMIWSGLALLFMTRMLSAVASGVRQGWEIAPMGQGTGMVADGRPTQSGRIPLASGIALVLLLANAALLGWWGRVQIAAGGLDAILNGPSNTEVVGASPTAAPVAQQPPTQEEQSDQDQSDQSQDTAAMPPEAPSSSNALTSSIPGTMTGVITETVIEPITDTVTEPMTGTAIDIAPAPVTVITAETMITPSAPVVLLPTPTPSAAVEPAISLTVRSAAGANIRATPSLDGEIVTVIADGTVLPVLGRTADGEWFQIRLDDNRLAWISIRVAEVNGAIEEIPVVNAS